MVQLSRNQHFSASFYHAVEILVNTLMPHITQKYKDNLDAARNANHSLAVFIKVGLQLESALNHLQYFPCSIFPTALGVNVSSLTTLSLLFLFSHQRCFTFMDRGFVFKQINNYMNCFIPGDSKVLKCGSFTFWCDKQSFQATRCKMSPIFLPDFV